MQNNWRHDAKIINQNYPNHLKVESLIMSQDLN